MSYHDAAHRAAQAITLIGAGTMREPMLEEVRKVGHDLAQHILHHIPSCPDQMTALSRAREAVMYADQALATHRG